MRDITTQCGHEPEELLCDLCSRYCERRIPWSHWKRLKVKVNGFLWNLTHLKEWKMVRDEIKEERARNNGFRGLH